MAKISFELSAEESKAFLAGLAAAASKGAAKGKPKADASDELEDAGDEAGEDAGDEGDEAGEDAGDEGDLGDEGDGEDGPDRNDVQTALRAYAAVSSKALAIKLMESKGGTNALSKLKEAKFAAVIDAAKAATKKAKAAKK